LKLVFFIIVTMFAATQAYIPTCSNSITLATNAVQPGEGVIILNSFPKSGSYTDAGGREFGYGIIRTTVMNESGNPFQLTINFPADSFAIFSSRDAYIKLFVPPDSISLDKISFDKTSMYVPDGLKPFFDTGLDTPTVMEKTVNPKETITFYIGALYHGLKGVPRAELVLIDGDLFYRAGMLTSELIPCGKIVFKN
jgi:hypothetical protein